MPLPRESVWCPRCGGPVAPDLDAGAGWECARHGRVPGLYGFAAPSVHGLLAHVTQSVLPTWLPWPLPNAWSVAGTGRVVDDTAVATVLALSGSDPLGAAGDLLLIAEDPGVGLGAHYAGLASPDPGPIVGAGPADARVVVNGHPTPLWFVDVGDECQVCVGEAAGRWLWLIAWPPLASAAVLMEASTLVDLHDLLAELDLIPLSEVSPRLLAGTGAGPGESQER